MSTAHKNKNTRRALLSFVLTLPVVPTLFWLGGYNFDHRGIEAVVCLIASVSLSIISAGTSSLCDEGLYIP